MKDQAATLKSITGTPMVLQGVSASGSVRGLLFELDVAQRYRNPSAANIEAVYTFPVPAEAVLLDLSVTIGGRELNAAVVERRKAEARYEAAIGEGDAAIMLERAADGLCTLNLGNLMGGEEAVIRYRYAQLLRFQHGSVRINVPTVIAPRYGAPAEGGLKPHQAPATDLCADYPFELSLELRGEIARGMVRSPSHRIVKTHHEDGVRLTPAETARLDRDFVLEITELPARSLAVVGRDGDRYLALASFCAEPTRAAEPAPMTLKLLIDCSGSMAGDSIAAARRALQGILERLQPQDRFSLSRFGSTVESTSDGLQPASASNVAGIARAVAAMQADLGGTEMERALRAVFALGSGQGADVLLITDGEIWNVDRLIDTARQARQRVFVVGIGAAPAEAVLRRLAHASGGACEFVAPDEDAGAAILRMFLRLRAPCIAQALVAWPSHPAWTTQPAGSVFAGETVHAFAGFDALPSGVAALTLLEAAGKAAGCATASLPQTVDNGTTLARIAAAQRLPGLEREAQTELALRYQLLTEYTNLIVVHSRADGEKAIDLPRLAQVAQMHAAGWGGVGSVSACMAASFDHFAVDTCNVDSCDDEVGLPPQAPGLRQADYFEGGPVGPIEIAKRFIARLEHLGADPSLPLPSTLSALMQLGAPLDLLGTIRNRGARLPEVEIVRATLEALALVRADEEWMSRGLRRRLLRLFASSDDCAALRERIRACVASWLGIAVPVDVHAGGGDAF